MEELRRDGEVALVGESVGDVADVVVHAEGLLEHDDRARRVGLARGVDRKAGGSGESLIRRTARRCASA